VQVPDLITHTRGVCTPGGLLERGSRLKFDATPS
jgi:hypothetical protein